MKKLFSYLICLFLLMGMFIPVNAQKEIQDENDTVFVQSNAAENDLLIIEDQPDENEQSAIFSITFLEYVNKTMIEHLVVEENEQKAAFDGFSWDADTKTMCFTDFHHPEMGVKIESYYSYIVDDVTVRIEGDNEICELFEYSAGTTLIVNGEGTLTLGRIMTRNFTIESGSINLLSRRLIPLMESSGMTYPTNDSTGYALYNMAYGVVEEPNLYRFLGGTVNISGDYLAGIDVQSGNIEIANTDIKIDIPKYGRFGLAAGWADERTEQYWGGDLSIANSRVEIIVRSSSGYMTYFYKMNGNDLNYYVGKNKSQKKVKFDEAFKLQVVGNIKRYSRNTNDFPGMNYLLITDENLFADVVDRDKYYYDPVYWAFNHEPQITTGTSETTFSPDDPCSRGHIVTFLWRLKNKPMVEYDMPFTDVKEGKFFYDAVAWAASTGVTTGTSATTFSPNDKCTRGHIVTFLWRAMGYPEPETIAQFDDVKEGKFYYKAVSWAFENGITTGTSATKFSPNDYCTRGQAVTFLQRAAKLQEAEASR